MDEDERQRKLEAGRAKLASFRQKRAKSVSAGASKKTSKRKGPTVPKNDVSTQNCHVEPAPPSANDAELESKTNHNQELQEPERAEPGPTQQQKDEASDLEENLSPGEELRDEELLALTDKDQLKQLQQAVEKRNEIIAKLSSNLQDALASRDQVQMEAQSLAGQIQSLQKQLQQTSADFLRIKSQSEAEVLNTCRQQLPNSNSSLGGDLRHEDIVSEGSGREGPVSRSCVKVHDNDMENVLHKLRAEVEQERQTCQSLSAKLTEELEKHQHLLSLLEQEKKGREDERTEKESQLQNLRTQLSQVQSQCVEMQQYKEEKENLNREVLELKKRLQEEEDGERRQREELATFALQLQSLEEERRLQDVEMRRLKEEHSEEVERVRHLLQEKENEDKFREEEIIELKEYKNMQNKVEADLSYVDDVGEGDDHQETGPDQDSMNVVVPQDLILEKYLTSVPIAHSQFSLVNESIEHCSQLDISADQSFELNSELFGEEPLLSISSRPLIEVDDVQNLSSSPCYVPMEDGSNPHWPLNSTCEDLDESKLSEQQTDLEKVLLHQQCGDLHEELALKDRDLNVLREEVVKTTEELEEARSRWAQVTEELRQALWELEEEKEKRRQAEEMTLNTHELDSLQNNMSVQTEKGEKEMAEFHTEKEIVKNLTLVSLERDLPGEQEEEEKGEYKDAVHLSDQTQSELLVSSLQESYGSNQLQTLQEHCENLQYDLEETKSKLRAALLTQTTSDATLQELETTRAQVLNVQAELDRLQNDLEKSRINLDCAEKEKKELESQVFCLKQNLANLEEAQAQVVQEKEEHKRKGEEMDERIKQMEQVLEEELEQFENLLKAKDVELVEEKEKWEEEKQEKEKELLEVKNLLEIQRKEKEEELKFLLEKQVQAVEDVEEKLRSTHQQELKTLMEKHQQEISELNIHLENELLKQRASIEEEQKRQISLIKQVTEREHERAVSELTVRHSEELSRLKTELSVELRESLEAAHDAELQQVQAQKLIEFEALRLSLTTDHVSQLDRSQTILQEEQESALIRAQASMRETFAQEKKSLQAEHQLELDRLRHQNQEHLEMLREQQQRDLDELIQTWETRVAQERTSMEEKHVGEIEALRLKCNEEAEAARSILQTSLSQSQDNLTNTQQSLVEVKKSLSEAQSQLQESQTRLEELQVSSKKENQKLEEELKQAWADRDAAACSLEELVSSHKAVLLEKNQQVRHLEEMERQLQQEVLNVQKEKTLLKQSSEEEVSGLWTQLENMRASRQELGELKEQLLARSSRVDDIECLKAEFNKQKRGIKEQNEAELENLRRYFEKRLQAAEESYREELALLQLRLVQGALEESVLSTANDSFISQNENKEENETSLNQEKHTDLLDTLQLQMEEKHSMDLSNLRSSLTVSFEEEVQQVRSELTDHYYVELQEMKTRHALEMEQLKAKVSEGHLRELTRIQAEASRQVEAEIELRLWCHSEELHSRLTIIHNLENRLAALNEQYKAEVQNTQKMKKDFAAELSNLEEALNEEREQVDEMRRLREELQQKHDAEITALRSDLDTGAEERAHDEKALSEEKQHVTSLQTALDNHENSQGLTVSHSRGEQDMNNQTEVMKLSNGLQEPSDEQLQQTAEKFEKEKQLLEQSLVQKYETSLAELRNKHQNELEHERANLQNKHAAELDALSVKHREQIDSLSASHRDQLRETRADLESQHNAQIVALESALHSKQTADLQSLEAVLLETSQAQLEALEAELTRKHQDEKDELEKRLLGNMDTLEATYLKEVQLLRDELMQLEEKHQKDLSHQISEREELRKEMAQVHMEKFSAMAVEFTHVHKAELAAQKESLDIDHCKALETLKKQVLELEQQHNNALQELTHTYSAEKEHLIQEHQLKLQDLKSVSARELEACRRELEEESSRQRQHFVEEVELLKIQSEEKLQDKINQLKTEFEDQKEVELEDLRRSFTSEQQKKEQSYTDKMSQLTTQLQQLDAVVTQLRAEVDCLQGELEGKRAEMETLDTLLQRRERESQEGGNLLKMLTDDLHSAKEERHKLYRANEKLSKVLIDMVRGTVATEELIGQKISAKTVTSHQKSSVGIKDSEESGITVGDMSAEEQELTQLLCESLLVSDSQVSPEGEEAALNACSRLRNTVCTLLELLNHANTQLEETHDVHLSLEEKFSQGREDSTQLLKQHKLLAEQLEQEAKLKSQLQLELHKAEGLLDGYMAEKVTLEESLQLREAQEERLVEELEDLKKKLRRMESLSGELDSLRQKHQELSEENSILLRQKEHLCSDLGEREKALLAETERLAQDRLDLQRQAERDHRSLSQRLRVLERDLEEQETKGLETELHHKTHTDDLNQHVQALEKQLKHERQFIQEQTVEREHERDEFQQEIRRLESHLRQTSVDNKGNKVESLQAIIKDKMEDHASLLAANQQAQRDVAERNEEIDKMAGRIRELEQALLNSADNNRAISELEQELHKTRLREQELTQDKQALEQQQLSNKLQISALQSKLDETRHCYHDNMRDPTQELRDALDTAQQSLQNKEREVETVLSQLENVQSSLIIKETELKHLTLQLELLSNQNAARVIELQEEIAALKENVTALTLLQEERDEQSEVEETKEETLPSALLQEKNQEIDHLNDEVQRLEQELENIKNNKNLEVELDDLRSQVEHLQSEITRLRQDKEEEEERLHEVISTLQAELATLGPNLHEVSDSQDGDSINPSPARSPEPQQDQERRSEPSSLKQELSLIHSASSRSLRSRLKVLQGQLETALAEREGLERLLLTQEEEYKGHGQELGKRLRAEKEKVDELQGLLNLKEAELEEMKVQVEEEKNKRKVTEKEKEKWEFEAKEAASMHEEKAHLNIQLTELQNKELERVREIETLKTKEQNTEIEISVLRETSLTLERQIQEVRAELVDMEKLVDVKQATVQTLEAANKELSAENEDLRRRGQQLQDDTEQLKQGVASLRSRVQDVTVELEEKKTLQEEAQKEILTHAEVTLAKADGALRQKEDELIKLKETHEALRTELTTVKQDLSVTAERAEILQEDGQNKDRAVLDLENDNQLLKAELQSLQESLAVQEEELANQQKELKQLQQRCQGQGYKQKDFSHRAFADIVSVSHDEVSLSSPEVLRRQECLEDRVLERFHASILESRLSELSALNSTGLTLPQIKTSPRLVMEPPQSRTLTPDPPSHSTHSPRTVSASDNYSIIDSLYTDKAEDLEELDLTTPSSPLGSTSSMSAPEWASDGYGSNVSSELGARLREELEHTERLDAQFVEYLRCRGMNPAANTDSAAGSMSYSDDLLSPELQGLLKKVYQESCRILTLSQRRPTSSSQSHAFSLSQNQCLSIGGPSLMDQQDKTSSNPPMTWQQEKKALQETVIALRELLCRMAQRQTQHFNKSEQEWQRYQLPADVQIETRLQTELEESQKQLKCALETRQEQHNKIHSLRQAIEEGEEALKREQTKVHELQQQLEQERDLTVRQHKQGEERKEALQVSLEGQRSEVTALKSEVEQERVISSNLRRELQIEQSRSEMLEKRADDAQRQFEDERQRSVNQQDVYLKENSHLQHLLTVAESRLSEIHSKLAEAHNKLDEERDRCSRQVEELSHRHEADAARDRTFISEMRAQLEQERRQGEELATLTNKLRAELLDCRRKWEEKDRARREELQREQEAATRCRVAAETLKIQKQEAMHDLEVERKRSKHQGVELAELKERIQAMKDNEREREEQWERERTKGKEEQMERERRQARTNSKLSELELLRQQDQQCMQELHNTLAELQREEKEMAAQRLSGRTGHKHKAASKRHQENHINDDDAQASSSHQNQQTPSMPPASGMLDRLLNENLELTEQVTSLSQERATLKHRLMYLERQLRHSENELAKVTSETENRPISDVTSNHKIQRLYERYLRAESFRKALVYQKRYLLLLLGGFQECEQATLCLIARMGARPSTMLATQQRPLVRFRSAVRAVIAVSRMKFLTRKWQKAIRRLSLTGTVNGHAQAPKVEVLRQQQQQQPRSSLDSPPNRETVSALVPPSKSPFRLHNRTYSNSTLSGGAPQDSERSLTEYIHHLEKVQQRLLGNKEVGKAHLAVPPKEERRIQSACSPDMIGYRQRWLQENRTWLYLSCLSPLYLNGPGSSLLHFNQK